MGATRRGHIEMVFNLDLEGRGHQGKKERKIIWCREDVRYYLGLIF